MAKIKHLLTAAVAAVVTVLCVFCLVACGTGGKDTQALEAPKNLKIVDEVLEWDEVNGADGYEVEIDERIYQTEKAELDTFLLMCEPKTYLLRVRAVDGSNNNSAWSESVDYSITFPSMIQTRLINNNTEYEIRAGYKGGVKGKLVIPQMFNGKPITSLAAEAFKDCKSLTSVLIPDTVTSIGYKAFSGCENLTTVRLPSDLKKIYDCMFSDCVNLKKVDMPDSLSGIEREAFVNCKSLTEINIPSGVRYIDNKVFENCASLTEVELPRSLSSIGTEVFAYCESLSSLTVDIENPYLQSDGNCVIRLRDDVLVCGIKTSVIPDYVTEIAEGGFKRCSGLTEITIPGNVKKIGNLAFFACPSLKKVTVESGVQFMNNVFSSCPVLEEVVFPDTLTYLSGSISICGSLKSITIEGDNPNATYKSDGNCIIRKADNVMVIGCMGSDIPDYVERIEDAFVEAPVTHVTVKTDRAKEKEYGVIELPTGLKSLGATFTHCERLKSVQLPDEVTSISSSAFSMCSILDTVIVTENSKLDLSSKDMFSAATVYTSYEKAPDAWGASELTHRDYNVITGCNLEDDGRLYVDSFVWNENCLEIGTGVLGSRIYSPYRDGHKFVGWAKDEPDGNLLDGLKTLNRASTFIDTGNSFSGGPNIGESTYIRTDSLKDLPANTVLYAVWEEVSAS